MNRCDVSWRSLAINLVNDHIFLALENTAAEHMPVEMDIMNSTESEEVSFV